MGVAASLARKGSKEDFSLAPSKPVDDRADSKIQANTNTRDSKIYKEDDNSTEPPPIAERPRRMSLQDMMTPAAAFSPRQQSVVNIWDTEQLTVGDIVKVTREGHKDAEGIVIEKISNTKLRVDLGERIADVLIDDCFLLVHNYEFEVGDKVEARPPGIALFFVGKVIKINPDKSMDILMDGDDLGDIERGITPDNCRKLMSRRSVVINRWKRAFMMVVAANFFKRISFSRNQSHINLESSPKPVAPTLFTHEEDEKYSI